MSQATAAQQISGARINPRSFSGLAIPAALTVALALGLLGAGVMGDAVAAALWPHLTSVLGSTSTGGSAVLIALLHAAVLVAVVIHARMRGWRLAACLSGAYWLITWLLVVIEAVLFLGPLLPSGFVAWTAVSQGLVAMTVGPLAVVLLSVHWPPANESPEHPPLLDKSVTPAAWALRLGGVSLVYIAAYITAGIFIAFQNPTLQEFYEVIGMPSTSIMLSVQVGRALLWAGAAALLLLALDLTRGAAALTVGVVFSAIMASLALTPNPFMPAEIRPTHFVEIAASNFVFGFAATWILTRPSRQSKERAVAPVTQ
ncbi:MAG: hypothetical protein ABFS14_09575 [Gemmatimonadota bacterium]